MNQIAQSDWLPEQARWSHLAHSGLPAVSRKKNFPESHIINPLLTKFVRSRWLDIGFVLFCEFMDLEFVSAHKHSKKDLANIQPSWPHTWSITHTNRPTVHILTSVHQVYFKMTLYSAQSHLAIGRIFQCNKKRIVNIAAAIHLS